eukprot:g46729.t1
MVGSWPVLDPVVHFGFQGVTMQIQNFCRGTGTTTHGRQSRPDVCTQSRPQPHPAMADPATTRRKTQTGQYYPKLEAACPPLGMFLPRKSKQTKAVTLVIL